jgi:hypothetical protein
MISGSEWLLEVSRTILPDPQEAIGKTTASLTMQPIKAFTNGLRDCPGHGLARELRQFLHEPVGFVVFNIESHVVIPFYHKGNLPPSAIKPPGPGHAPSIDLNPRLAASRAAWRCV